MPGPEDGGHPRSRSPGSRHGRQLRDRAVSSAVAHALAIGISSLLVVLLVTSLGGFVQDESERVTREELDALGARLADDVAAADRLTRHGGTVRVAADVPDRLVNSQLRISLARGADCTDAGSGTCLVLAAPARDLTVRQPLRNRSAVALVRTNGTVFIRSTAPEGAATGSQVGAPKVPATVGIGRAAGGGTVVVGNRDPVAGFVFRPGNPVAGDRIRFTNDTSDLDGRIREYEWTFELPDDANRTVTGPSVNQTYDVPGVYRATLDVTDDDGETDTVSRRVPVSGLVETGDAAAVDGDGDGRRGGVNVTFNNTWDEPATLLTVAIDTADDVDALTEETATAEVTVDAGSDGSTDAYAEYNDGTRMPDEGLIVDLNRDGDDPTVSAGETVSVEFTELQDGGVDLDDAEDDPVRVAVRYRVNGSFYVTSVPLFGNGTGPTVGWGDASDWDGALTAENVSHPDGVVRLDAASGGGPPERDLRVWLPLNETGSPDKAIDYAGSTEYEFDVRGSPTTGVTGVNGSGRAYGFDGDDWLLDGNAEDNYFYNRKEFTLSMWVRADATGTDYGLLDTVDDGGDGDDDELGLRYDSDGWAGDGEDSFKASVAVREGFWYDSYSYEYESDTQSTDWQHVLLRWEKGGRLELFVDGRQLPVRAGDGQTAQNARLSPGVIEFLAVGRSQKDDTDALWQGRIDEVRIYDRALDDSEVKALAARGGLREGSIETDWKTTGAPLDLQELELGYDATRRGGTIEVTVLARRDDGTVVQSDPVTLSGDAGVREVRGLAGDADEFRLIVELRGSGDDPSADAFTLSD
jgi:hypothetical protein